MVMAMQGGHYHVGERLVPPLTFRPLCIRSAAGYIENKRTCCSEDSETIVDTMIASGNRTTTQRQLASKVLCTFDAAGQVFGAKIPRLAMLTRNDRDNR